jgi:hypothetical protein
LLPLRFFALPSRAGFLPLVDWAFQMFVLNKQSAKRFISIAGGVMDYVRDPGAGTKWTAFNGQARRREIFEALAGLDFAAIIETGTYLGTTTQCFAETGLPVFSIEGHARRYGFVKARFLRFRNVSLRLGDTRLQLRKILAELKADDLEKPLFFYLDAHWKRDLPLGDELRMVLESCAQPTIMIDDFEVSGDPGYGFDNYGEGKALTRQYIEPMVSQHRLSAFYPAASSAEETGLKRGCVVLAKEATRERLALLPQLRLASA